MKKSRLFSIFFLTVSLAVLAAIAGLPFWFGLEAEKSYQRVSQQLADKTHAKVVTTSYERGWLSSRAETTITPVGLPFTFIAEHKITHGPVAIAQLLNGSANFSPVQAIVDSVVTVRPTSGDKNAPALSLPPLHLKTVIDLSGQGNARLDLQATKFTLGNGNTLELKGVEGNILFGEANGTRFDLAVPELAVRGAHASLVASGISANSDLHDGAAGYPLGTTSFTVTKLSLTDPEVKLEGVRFTSNARATGPDLTLAFQQQVKALSYGGAGYGPLDLNLELRRLDAPTLMKLSNTINELQKQGLPPEQARLMAMGKGLELVAALAKKAPEMEVSKLSIKTPAGDITGRAKFVLDGSKLDLNRNPMLLVNAFGGDGELMIPASLIEGIARQQLRAEIETMKTNGSLTAEEARKLTDAKIGSIVDQALPGRMQQVASRFQLLLRGSAYEVHASLRRGRLSINNQPLTQGVALP